MAACSGVSPSSMSPAGNSSSSASPVLPDQQQAMGGEKFRDQENRSGTAFPGDCFPEAGPVPVAIFQLLQGEPFSASDFFASDNFHESSSYSEKRT